MDETKPHVLILAPSKAGADPALEVECPGVDAGGCRTTWECMAKGCEPDDDGMAHGVEHRTMHFGWGVQSEDCWVQNYDEIWESVREMFAEAHREVAPGRYEVDIDCHDEYLDLTFARPLVAAGGGGEGNR